MRWGREGLRTLSTMNYRVSQFTVLPFVFFVAISVFVVVMSMASDGAVQLLNLFLVAIGLVVLIFSRLTVSVDEEHITAAFGLGWPKKVLGHTDIVSAAAVRNKWWYGLGIRLIPHGWMYNVWGLDAVELTLSSGRKFRIGTADRENLLAAISVYHRAI